MATVKAYTDLEQSKKLAEILPLESADMYWSRCTITDFGDGVLKVSYTVEPCNISQFRNTKEDIPCWSLASLLGVLSKTAHSIDEDGSVGLGSYKNIEWGLCLTNTNVELFTANNPVDACYKMIIKLNELNLL